MARWEADNEQGSNLTLKSFSCIRMRRELGTDGGVTSQPGVSKCTIPHLNGLQNYEVLLRIQRLAMARWIAANESSSNLD